MKRRLQALLAGAAAVTMAVTLTGAAEAVPERYERYHAWFDAGPVDYPLYNTRWVPQGLTNLGDSRLVTSYYDSEDDSALKLKSRIVITDLAGVRKKSLWLDTKGHVGGLAATSEWLWIADGGDLRRYSRRAIANAEDGDSIRASYVRTVLGKASYAYASGETVWVGDFNWDYDGGVKTCPEYNEDLAGMYQYRVNSNDQLDHVRTVRTPGSVQGLTVTGTRYIWSTSCGRDNDSRIVVWDRARTYDGTNDYGNVYTAPNMSEGMTRIGAKLFLIFEAGSSFYDDADYRVRTIHRGKGSIPEAYGDGWPG